MVKPHCWDSDPGLHFRLSDEPSGPYLESEFSGRDDLTRLTRGLRTSAPVKRGRENTRRITTLVLAAILKGRSDVYRSFLFPHVAIEPPIGERRGIFKRSVPVEPFFLHFSERNFGSSNSQSDVSLYKAQTLLTQIHLLRRPQLSITFGIKYAISFQ